MKKIVALVVAGAALVVIKTKFWGSKEHREAQARTATEAFERARRGSSHTG